MRRSKFEKIRRRKARQSRSVYLEAPQHPLLCLAPRLCTSSVAVPDIPGRKSRFHFDVDQKQRITARYGLLIFKTRSGEDHEEANPAWYRS